MTALARGTLLVGGARYVRAMGLHRMLHTPLDNQYPSWRRPSDRNERDRMR